MNNSLVLYIGGFELPDKNAAAQRVIGIAKGLQVLGYNTVFLNSLKNTDKDNKEEKEYFGFQCYEYKREPDIDYLVTAKTVLEYIDTLKPDIVIAYNYPGSALNRIRRYCKKRGIKCYADATEWYKADEGNIIFRIIKTLDTEYRMRYVHKKLDGIIAISEYLFQFYCNAVRTVKIPPTVDITDTKWSVGGNRSDDGISFVYAGSPSKQKERLDIIVKAIERIKTDQKIRLNILGITKEQFADCYSWKDEISDRIVFMGRVEHIKVIEITRNSNWTIILRDNNSVVNAGFPTKLVESISCGTPVIVNAFSNVRDYMTSENSVVLGELLSIDEGINKALDFKPTVDSGLFDYHNYIEELKNLTDCGS